MKMMKYLPILACGLLVTGCNTGKQQKELTAGIQLENLDTTALPGTDFYRYACGGWMDKHPLSPEYSSYGTFTELAENNRKQIQELIEEVAAATNEPGSVAQKIGDLYNLAMDSVKLNEEGMEPIRAELEEIASLQPADVYTLLASLQKKGVSAYLGLYVGADEKNSNMNAVQIGQSGLSMGDRDYYLEQDPTTTAIRKAFTEHVSKMFALAGFDDATAQRASATVMEVETRLAKVFRSRTDLRDPHANYHKMTMEEVRNEYADFNWDAYLGAMGLKEVKEIIIGQPASLKEAVALLKELPADKQVLYLQWKLIDQAASYLNDAFARQNFDFYERTMSGTKEMRPRWKNAVAIVSSSLGEAVGQMYVQKYFPAAAKERMVSLVKNLQESLKERIMGLEWMSAETKEKALEKLATFHVKVGYPDVWKDYSTLDIRKDSYWANVARATAWEYDDMLSRAGKPVDKDEWLMTPQTVNAYYNPTTNEICFPAAILQPPFFDMDADDAFNYGAIGVVIGHEMTHGFDDQGREYDKEGNLKNWWTAEDTENFRQRAEVMVDFFNNIEVAPGVKANGRMTLGENIADHGGLQVSFQAFKKATEKAPLAVKEGFTPEQRFFLAYANVWAGNIRPEAVLQLTKIDVHSLGKWRVNGALPHIGAWYEAFGITENDPLYIPVEKRVSIW